MTSEDREAIAFVEAFERQWPSLAGRLLHLANEGGFRGLHAGYHEKRRRMGVRKGTSDYFLAVESCSPAYGEAGEHGLWLELKAPFGVVKPDQLAFLRLMNEAGYACVVAWGWTAAMDACRHYLTLSSPGGGWKGVYGYGPGVDKVPMEMLTYGGRLRRGAKEAGSL